MTVTREDIRELLLDISPSEPDHENSGNEQDLNNIQNTDTDNYQHTVRDTKKNAEHVGFDQVCYAPLCFSLLSLYLLPVYHISILFTIIL